MKKLLMIAVCLFAIGATAANAQAKTITGTVTDEFNEPLPGVSVIERGTTNGTITDMYGNYSINVAGPASELQFSYVGYLTITITVGGYTVINVQMIPDVSPVKGKIDIGLSSQGDELTIEPAPQVKAVTVGGSASGKTVSVGGNSTVTIGATVIGNEITIGQF